MTKYSVREYEAACSLLDLEYSKEYLNAPINGIRVIVDRKAGAISLDIPEAEYLITPEEADIEQVIDALHTALMDKTKIEQKIEEQKILWEHREKKDDEQWRKWPQTKPEDDSLYLVGFYRESCAKVLTGYYKEEFSLWVFPTLENRVYSFGMPEIDSGLIHSVTYKKIRPVSGVLGS